MNLGRTAWAAICGALALAAVSCSGSDTADGYSATNPRMGDATPGCGTAQHPLELELKDVSPALDATVTNLEIVQSFTIVGKLLKINPSFATPAAHTAGGPVPSPLTWTYAADGTNTVYTSQRMAWEKAGHVELTPPGLLVTDDGCVSVLPTPTFQYDVTAP